MAKHLKCLVEKLDNGNILILSCPACQTKHTLKCIGYQNYMLNENPDDHFEINDLGRMWPWFVCRNVTCRTEGGLLIPNF